MKEGRTHRPIVIVVAEDDPDDRMLAREGFRESRLANEVRFVCDGEELMDYLHQRDKYSDPALSPRPGLIMLDLKMPRMSGGEALVEIRADPCLRCIPIVVMTTSKLEEDILNAYNDGANSYITKPVTFSGLVAMLETLGKYWLEIVELPPTS